MPLPRPKMNAVHLALLASAALLLPGCGGADEGGSSPEAERRGAATEDASESGHKTPEEAVRSLVLGIVARNEAAIRRAILPDEHAAVLWSGDRPPPEQLQPLLDELEQQLTARRLEPGDTVPLPGGQEHVLSEDVLSEDRQVVVAERDGRPMLAPLFVERTDDGWRVDAGPVIAAHGLRQTRPAE